MTPISNISLLRIEMIATRCPASIRGSGLMKICFRMQVILSLSLWLLPLTLTAQKFQEPTRDELQMTSDQKFPGVPAIFLYREKSTDNFNHFVSEYARIKVLTELGKEWATVEVPYSGSGAPPRIEGRTIHADGTVVPLIGKAEDLLVVKNAESHLNARVFTLPSVEVGSILEYRWTLPNSEGNVGGVTNDMQGFMNSALAGAIPYWDVQSAIPIRKEHFYYNPLGDLERNVIGNQGVIHYNSKGEIANYLLFSARLPPGAHLQPSPNRDYVLDLQDVPAIRHEANAPPAESRVYGVRFYYSPYLAGDVFWANEGKLWAKEIDHAAEPSDELRAASAQITAGATTDEEKARKLYDAVQALDNTAFSRQRGEAERIQLGLRRDVRGAGQVWSEKSGTRNEVATLYLALARAAGLQASAMSIADRRERIFDPGYLSLDQLAVTLVVLHINGAEVFLDPGEKFLPYGQLRWSHMLCGGLLETADGVSHSALTPANLSKDAISAHAADLIVDAQGAISGTVKIVTNGPEALRWRQLNLTADNTEVQRQLNESLPGLLPQGIVGEISNIQGLTTSAGYVSVTVKVSGRLGTVTGKRIMLPAFFFSSVAHEQFLAEERREAPIDLRYAEQVIDDVVYHLPSGYAVESAPQAVQLPWPDRAALVIKTQPAPGVVDIKHIFARAFVLLDPKEYPTLRDYYQKMAATNQQQVILLPGAAAGN
jgi:Domain of Unknown Function with PDB structure (DUF3857)/Transglutaminase-like superfamily